jgi:hypothetical protein
MASGANMKDANQNAYIFFLYIEARQIVREDA